MRLWFFVLLTGAYFASVPYAISQELSPRNEQLVYSALLNEAIRLGVPDLRIVISSMTNWDDVLRTTDAAEIKARLPDASELVISDYLRTNQIPAAVDLTAADLRPEVRFAIVPSEALTAIFMDHPNPFDAWTVFHQKFADFPMILSFSRVGFDRGTGQALFYYSSRCGPICGTGNIVLMRVEAGQWTTVAHVMMWIS